MRVHTILEIDGGGGLNVDSLFTTRSIGKARDYFEKLCHGASSADPRATSTQYADPVGKKEMGVARNKYGSIHWLVDDVSS